MSFPSAALAYSALVRWSAGDGTVAGYLLYVRENGGGYGAPIDVGFPQASSGDQLETVVGDLAVATTYTFALKAYGADGETSALSNERTIGYRQAAVVVDSDHDGRSDAAEDVNLNRRRDPGETDRLIADTDGDHVPDGVEIEYGSDPLTPGSPACDPLDFDAWTLDERAGAEVIHDAAVDDDVLVVPGIGRRALRKAATYPADGTGQVHSPLFVTRIRADQAFRIELRVRSTAGRVYRLRYQAYGGADRVTSRRLTVALGDYFAGDRYVDFGRNVAADLALIDAAATLGAIERITLSGAFAMARPRACR